MRRLPVIAIGVLGLLAIYHSPYVIGCAPAPPPGYHVSVLDEFALIVWDANTKTEHFIRVANFETRAPEMGFLVPTPTVPELFEVDADQLARTLHQQTRARTVYQSRTVTKFGLGPWDDVLDATRAAAPSMPASVEVIRQQEIAGYEASVLRADDPAALKSWLEEHEYETTDEIESWLQIYTEQGWIITAFKLVKSPDIDRLKTKAVRMSFQSEQPFYPYREPESDEQATGSRRLLRVFLLADQRYDARIGDSHPWQASTVWSGKMDEFRRSWLTSPLGIENAPGHLTEYEDHSSPRPGFDELYFQPSEDQSQVERPPITQTITNINYVPGWRGALFIGVGIAAMPVMLVLVVGGWFAMRRRSSDKRPK